MKVGTASALDRAASIWVARHALGPLSETDKQAFDRWCEEDDRHRRCFDRLQGVLMRTDGAESALRHAHEHATLREAAARRRRIGDVAASLCVIAVSAGIWVEWPADLQTGRGQLAEYRLQDGSRVWLDANSAVDVEIGASERRLRLREGRIHVSVAHEGRPFSVSAGGRDVVDVGTEFDVTLETGGASAQVTGGRVAVVDKASRTPLAAGQGLRWQDSGRAFPTNSSAADEALAWRKGELVFHRRPLREVIAMLDRYSHRRLWLANGAAGDRLVSGVVRANDIEHGLASIAQSQGLSIRDWGLVILLR